MGNDKDKGFRLTVGGITKIQQERRGPAPIKTGQPSTDKAGKAGKEPARTAVTEGDPKTTDLSPKYEDTLDKSGGMKSTKGSGTPGKGGGPKGVRRPATPGATGTSRQSQKIPGRRKFTKVSRTPGKGAGPQGVRSPATLAVHRTRNRNITARNEQIANKDTAKQNKIIKKKAAEIWGTEFFDKPVPPPAPVVLKTRLNNKFSDPANLETTLVDQLRQAPVEDTTSSSTSGRVADPNNAFVQPHEGASARTRIMGNFVLKGCVAQEQAEVEWVGNRLMQASGENTPDIVMASIELRNSIMEVDPGYKQLDRIDTFINPDYYKSSEEPMTITRITISNDPMHCLVMPRIFGTDMSNIVEDPALRKSFKKNMGVHIKELARIAFKDMILSNSDRIFRMDYGFESPPYLPTLENIEQYGSPMNLGNIMFQTVEGEVLPHSAVAIDNFGDTVNKLTTEEGQQHELAVFQYYMEDVKSTVTRAPAEVLKENHVTSNISKCLKKGIDSDPNFPNESLFTMTEEEMLSTVTEGVLLGWNQVNEHIDSLQSLLGAPITEGVDPTENTLAYIETVSKKLGILKGIDKPSL